MSISRVKIWTGEVEWYTPRRYLDAAVDVMGGIDLDPASSARAQRHVKAANYFTVKQDGLQKKWSGRVWLNPPYAKTIIEPFVTKLLRELDTGRIRNPPDEPVNREMVALSV